MNKDDVKAAVREVFDESTVAYSQGAAKFARAVSESMAGLLDAFDDFFTTNLLEDSARSETAKAYIDARLELLQHSSEVIAKKLTTFRGHKSSLRLAKRTSAIKTAGETKSASQKKLTQRKTAVKRPA